MTRGRLRPPPAARAGWARGVSPRFSRGQERWEARERERREDGTHHSLSAWLKGGKRSRGFPPARPNRLANADNSAKGPERSRAPSAERGQEGREVGGPRRGAAPVAGGAAPGRAQSIPLLFQAASKEAEAHPRRVPRVGAGAWERCEVPQAPAGGSASPAKVPKRAATGISAEGRAGTGISAGLGAAPRPAGGTAAGGYPYKHQIPPQDTPKPFTGSGRPHTHTRQARLRGGAGRPHQRAPLTRHAR